MNFPTFVTQKGYSKNDVYVRLKVGLESEECYYVGKVCAQPGVCIAGAAEAQALCIKEHCRILFPAQFGSLPDQNLELLIAAGKTVCSLY